ncbi:MAG: polyamine aminopropyltransferase [Spirochaetota bacterium]
MEQRIFTEYLNNHHGFFYTIKRSLYRGRTRYQQIELVETDEFGTVLLLDNITQVAEKGDWQYHEPMVHYPMLAHRKPERVLIVGGGDGGTLREVVKHPVEHVDFVELDEEVVAFSREHLESVHQGAFDDPRMTLHFQDGRAWIENHPASYDVIIMDMTDPFGPSRMLYTREFFELVRRALRTEEGVFTMHSESPVARPVAYRCIGRTLGETFRHVRHAYAFVQMYATYWSYAVASPATDIASLSGNQIDERLAARAISDLRMINGATWESMQVPLPYISRIPTNVPIITDEHPVFPDHFSPEGGGTTTPAAYADKELP